MALTYTTYKSAIAALLSVGEANADFLVILPSIIEYAEGRIYRDLGLLTTTIRDSSATLTQNSRNFTLPTASGRFVVVEAVNVITPSGSGTSTGTRNPLTRASRKMADFLGPLETATANQVPAVYAMVTDQTLVVAPSPGASFTVEIIGTTRPTALSSGTTTTFLSNYLPDLLVAASMIFGSGWQKNFGAQSDDPRQAVAWEAQYKSLLTSAHAEEMRRKYNTTAAQGVPA